MKKNVFLIYVKNILLPCFLFSLVTGAITGVVVLLYKVAANFVIHHSEEIYAFLRLNPTFLPLAIAGVALVALIEKFIYIYAPDAKGGGISNAIIFVRGILTFKWLRTLIATLLTSLVTFFIGTPLGNEGPCVLAGTTIGRGVVNLFGKKNKAWDRYVMTGGACAGFSAATNAPISGLLFAIEEAHHRLSPMILMVAGTSACFALAVTRLLAPTLGIEVNLFTNLTPITLGVSDVWITVCVGIICGVFSVFYIKVFDKLQKFIKNHKKFNKTVFACLIFMLTVVAGYFSPLFIGTGHHLTQELLSPNAIPVYILLLAILIRVLFTAGSAHAGITGGTFIPTLAFGAIVSSVFAKFLIHINAIDQSYYQVIILLGMASCFSGATKTPLTAMAFAIEALALSSNVLQVCLACIFSFMISEIFCPTSINEEQMEIKIEGENEGKTPELVDAVLTVQEGSFVVGKLIRDVFWPNNLFVLSIKKSNAGVHVDEHGEKNIHPGDKLHVRYSTFDMQRTKAELLALVGEQEYSEDVWQESI